MKQILLLIALAMTSLSMRAQSYQPKDTPQLEFAMQLRVTLDNAIFVCQPEWNNSFKGIVLNVWKVK